VGLAGIYVGEGANKIEIKTPKASRGRGCPVSPPSPLSAPPHSRLMGLGRAGSMAEPLPKRDFGAFLLEENTSGDLCLLTFTCLEITWHIGRSWSKTKHMVFREGGSWSAAPCLRH